MSRFVRVFVIVVVIVCSVAAGASLALLGGDKIQPGVRVAGVDLGGLTIQEAEERLRELETPALDRRITLRYSEGALTCSLRDLGCRVDASQCAQAAFDVGRRGNYFRRVRDVIEARWHGIDLPLRYAFDRTAGQHYLDEMTKPIERQPVDATLAVEDGRIRIIPEKPGIRVDIDRSYQNVVDSIESGGSDAELVVVNASPEVTASDLEGIDDVIASYSTPYRPWQRDRTNNLRLACGKINGTLIKPGEVFSYNKVVGPRLKEYGFRNAPMFVNGEVEAGLGGGVCQVSTTVYNAALLADMKIVVRSHHSRPVDYAPVGRDATVAYPYPDFKFQNTSDAPIYITAWLENNRVNVRIYGKREEGKEVEIVTEGHTIVRAPVVRRTSEDLEPGKRVVTQSGRAGHRVSVYRIVKVNGEIVKKELISNDYYRPESRIITESGRAPETSQS